MDCPECAALRLEIAELNRALDGAVWVADDQAARISRKLGCTPQQSLLLALLYNANKTMLGREVTDGLPTYDHAREREDPDYASVVVHHLRKRLGRDVVLSAGHKRGYYLSPGWRALIAEALA